MASILTEKWLWIIIIVLSLIVVLPFVIVLFIVFLPFPYNTVATICLVIGWGIAAGYKEWVMSKGKEEKQRYES